MLCTIMLDGAQVPHVTYTSYYYCLLYVCCTWEIYQNYQWRLLTVCLLLRILIPSTTDVGIFCLFFGRIHEYVYGWHIDFLTTCRIYFLEWILANYVSINNNIYVDGDTNLFLSFLLFFFFGGQTHLGVWSIFVYKRDDLDNYYHRISSSARLCISRVLSQIVWIAKMLSIKVRISEKWFLLWWRWSAISTC